MKAAESRPEVRLKGIAAAPGVARGPAYPLMRGMAIVACENHTHVRARERLIKGSKLFEQRCDRPARTVLQADRDDAIDIVALHAEVAHDVRVL